MGGTNGYSSPKTSLFSSLSSPKSSSYESSKVEHRTVSRNFGADIIETPKKTSSLNEFRDILTSYLELSEQIEVASANLEQLKVKRRVLEEKIANDPQYEKFAELFNSMKGLRK